MQEKKVLRRMLLIIGESDEMYWARGLLMGKMAKMEIYWTGDISAIGRAVVGDESGKMLDQKMQKEMAHMKSVTDERWRVVLHSGHGALKWQK